MEKPDRPLPGTPVEGLDTPCLVVDLDALEHNIRVMADYYSVRACKLRPHVKNHKSPQIAHMQIRAGGTVGGVCAAKVAEAEVMVQAGISDVLVANQIVTMDKVTRLCGLAKYARITVACDDPRNAHDLAEGARAAGVHLGVLIEVDTGLDRCGVRSLQQGLDLAKAVQKLPGLVLRGVMSHQATAPVVDREARILKARQVIQKALDMRQAMEEAGIPVEIVSTGETWSYDAAGDMAGVTEVQGGSYILMDASYSYMSDFQFAAKVLATVVSAPRPGVAVIDAGIEALGASRGMPRVEGMPEVTVAPFPGEHAQFQLLGDTHFSVGDKVLLIPAHQDSLVNRWDRYVAARRGKVESVWEIPARGCHS